jgi:hypothetical protein
MRFKLQAASCKQAASKQATSGKLRRFVICSPDPNMIYCRSINKGERHESYNKSRMEMAGRTGPSFRGSYYPSSEGSRIRSRKRFHPGTSLGGQTKSQIQRRGAAATRRCSVSRFPSFRKNLITTVAPAKAGAAAFCRASLCLRKKQKAASVKQQVTSSKRQATSCDKLSRVTMSQRLKVQAASFKPQAASIKLQATSC